MKRTPLKHIIELGPHFPIPLIMHEPIGVSGIFFTTERDPSFPDQFVLRMFTPEGDEFYRLQYGFNVNSPAAIRTVNFESSSNNNAVQIGLYDVDENEAYTTNEIAGATTSSFMGQVRASADPSAFAAFNFDYAVHAIDLLSPQSNTIESGLGLEIGAGFIKLIETGGSDVPILVIQNLDNFPSDILSQVTLPTAMPDVNYQAFLTSRPDDPAEGTCAVIDTINFTTTTFDAVNALTEVAGVTLGKVSMTAIWIDASQDHDFAQLKIRNETNGQVVEFFDPTGTKLLVTLQTGRVADGNGAILMGKTLPATGYLIFTQPFYQTSDGTSRGFTSNSFGRGFNVFQTSLKKGGIVKDEQMSWMSLFEEPQPNTSVYFTIEQGANTFTQILRFFNEVNTEIHVIEFGFSLLGEAVVRPITIESGPYTNTPAIVCGTYDAGSFDGTGSPLANAAETTGLGGQTVFDAELRVGDTNALDGNNFCYTINTVKLLSSYNTRIGAGLAVQIGSNAQLGFIRYYIADTGEDIFVIHTGTAAVSSGSKGIVFPHTLDDINYKVLLTPEINSVGHSAMANEDALLVTGFDVESYNTDGVGSYYDNTVAITVYWARQGTFTSDQLKVTASGGITGNAEVLFFDRFDPALVIASLQFGHITSGASTGSVDIEEEPNAQYVVTVSPLFDAGMSNQLGLITNAFSRATTSFDIQRWDEGAQGIRGFHWMLIGIPEEVSTGGPYVARSEASSNQFVEFFDETDDLLHNIQMGEFIPASNIFNRTIVATGGDNGVVQMSAVDKSRGWILECTRPTAIATSLACRSWFDDQDLALSTDGLTFMVQPENLHAPKVSAITEGVAFEAQAGFVRWYNIEPDGTETDLLIIMNFIATKPAAFGLSLADLPASLPDNDYMVAGTRSLLSISASTIVRPTSATQIQVASGALSSVAQPAGTISVTAYWAIPTDFTSEELVIKNIDTTGIGRSVSVAFMGQGQEGRLALLNFGAIKDDPLTHVGQFATPTNTTEYLFNCVSINIEPSTSAATNANCTARNLTSMTMISGNANSNSDRGINWSCWELKDI